MADQPFNLSDNRQLVAFFVVTGLGALTSVVIAVLNYVTSSKAKVAAEKAADHMAPLGNGFAKGVTQALSRIEVDLLRIEGKVDHHIMTHADKEIINHEPFHR